MVKKFSSRQSNFNLKEFPLSLFAFYWCAPFDDRVPLPIDHIWIWRFVRACRIDQSIYSGDASIVWQAIRGISDNVIVWYERLSYLSSVPECRVNDRHYVMRIRCNCLLLIKIILCSYTPSDMHTRIFKYKSVTHIYILQTHIYINIWRRHAHIHAYIHTHKYKYIHTYIHIYHNLIHTFWWQRYNNITSMITPSTARIRSYRSGSTWWLHTHTHCCIHNFGTDWLWHADEVLSSVSAVVTMSSNWLCCCS